MMAKQRLFKIESRVPSAADRRIQSIARIEEDSKNIHNCPGVDLLGSHIGAYCKFLYLNINNFPARVGFLPSPKAPQNQFRGSPAISMKVRTSVLKVRL
jgi:hypothetical protein